MAGSCSRRQRANPPVSLCVGDRIALLHSFATLPHRDARNRAEKCVDPHAFSNLGFALDSVVLVSLKVAHTRCSPSNTCRGASYTSCGATVVSRMLNTHSACKLHLASNSPIHQRLTIAHGVRSAAESCQVVARPRSRCGYHSLLRCHGPSFSYSLAISWHPRFRLSTKTWRNLICICFELWPSVESHPCPRSCLAIGA